MAGTWDPHLVRVDGHWHLAFVAARRFFDFYLALARAEVPGGLDGWELLGAATDRRGTEGPQLRRLDGAWRVLASDGAGNPRALRERFPVFDLAMTEIGALEAPYPTNIPWPHAPRARRRVDDAHLRRHAVRWRRLGLRHPW